MFDQETVGSAKEEKGSPLLLPAHLGYCEAYRLCAMVELVGLAPFCYGWGRWRSVWFQGLVTMDTSWERKHTGIELGEGPLGSARE